MRIGIVKLTPDNLDSVCKNNNLSRIPYDIQQSYFSWGSVAYCLMDNGNPVFCGGIVNMQWQRGEAWMLPTPWFKKHIKTSLMYMKDALAEAASMGMFKRVQATCATSVSVTLFNHLGFYYEGILNHFGPNGEPCFMYARIFD